MNVQYIRLNVRLARWKSADVIAAWTAAMPPNRDRIRLSYPSSSGSPLTT